MKRFLNMAKLTALLAALLVGALAVGCGNGGGGTGPIPLVGVSISGTGVAAEVAGEEYNLTLYLGGNVTLTATAAGNAIVTTWAWESDDVAVASITGSYDTYSIVVRGEAGGNAEIEVTATGPGGTHTTFINVTVIPPPPVTAVTVSGAGIAGSAGVYTLTMGEGATVVLTADGNAPVAAWLWTTDAAGTANITAGADTASGTISAVAIGETSITVTATGVTASTVSATITVTVIPPPLDAPGNLSLQRGPTANDGMNNTLFWGTVPNSDEYIVFAFRDTPNAVEYYEYVSVTAATQLNLRTAFASLLTGDSSDPFGPLYFRVQAVGDGTTHSSSALSTAIGPFWLVDQITPNLTPHYREVTSIIERLEDPEELIIIIDKRWPSDRVSSSRQVAGNAALGSFHSHVAYPNTGPRFDDLNAQGTGWAIWQGQIITAWEAAKAAITPAQRVNLDPAMGYRDITVFVYCVGGARTMAGGFAMRSLGFTNVYCIGGFNAFGTVGGPMDNAGFIEAIPAQ